MLSLFRSHCRSGQARDWLRRCPADQSIGIALNVQARTNESEIGIWTNSHGQQLVLGTATDKLGRCRRFPAFLPADFPVYDKAVKSAAYVYVMSNMPGEQVDRRSLGAHQHCLAVGGDPPVVHHARRNHRDVAVGCERVDLGAGIDRYRRKCVRGLVEGDRRTST